MTDLLERIPWLEESAAQAAYQAYEASLVTEGPPCWGDLPEHERSAWVAAARRVSSFLAAEVRRG